VCLTATARGSRDRDSLRSEQGRLVLGVFLGLGATRPSETLLLLASQIKFASVTKARKSKAELQPEEHKTPSSLRRRQRRGSRVPSRKEDGAVSGLHTLPRSRYGEGAWAKNLWETSSPSPRVTQLTPAATSHTKKPQLETGSSLTVLPFDLASWILASRFTPVKPGAPPQRLKPPRLLRKHQDCQ